MKNNILLIIWLATCCLACKTQLLDVRGLATIKSNSKIKILSNDSIDAVSDSKFHGKLQLKQVLKTRGAFLMENAIVTTNAMTGKFEPNSFLLQKNSYLENLSNHQIYKAYIKTIHDKDVFFTDAHINEMRQIQIQCGNNNRTVIFVGTIQINDRDSSHINGIVSRLIKNLKFKTVK